MEIEYLDVDLQRAVHLDDQPRRWREDEVARLRRIVQCLQASRDITDVLSLRSLRLRQDRDDPKRVSTQLDAHRAVSVRFRGSDGQLTAIVDIIDHRTDVAG